ncbi:MAG: Asp-tRNA(Asn)/Glu-tRNA(Gln) amidotransferase subunit GatC [Gemmatimonadaceae bacterium]
MSISEHDVRHVANLARLGLEPDRVPHLAKELSGILGHMEVLAAVPTDGVEPMAGPPGESRLLRPDSVAPDPLVISREAIAPETRDGFFLVPRLDAHEDAAT